MSNDNASSETPALSSSYPHATHHKERIEGVEKRKAFLAKRLARFETRRQQLMTWRLSLGLALIIIGLVIAAYPHLKWLGFPFLGGVVLFAYLVRASGQIKIHQSHLEAWMQYCRRQSERLLGEYQAPGPSTDDLESDSDRILARDLYLTGPHSLFQMLDETFTQGGEKILKQWVFQPLKSKETILKRQKQVQHLAKHRWPIEKFTLLGGMNAEQLRTDEVKSFLERKLVGPQYKTFAFLHLLLFPLYIALILLMANGVIPGSPAWPVVIYAVFSLYSLKQVSDTFRRAEDLELSLSSLLPVWKLIESRPLVFDEVLKDVFTHQPSRATRPLNLYLSALSVEGHWLVHLIVNALTPWSFAFSGLCEAWRKRHQAPFLRSIEQLFYLEAVGSASLFHSYQTQVYPQIQEQTEFHVEEAYHPLIDRHHVVANSIALKPPLKLALITGSNMSGKSTFLRTLGINQQLALMGLPVFASAMTTFIGPVYTCLQISDSLATGYSSFYYEVRRVREIIERARDGEAFLYLVDEIFRGTNNRERLIGSQAVLQQLLEESTSLGLVSTHDLELTQLGDTFSELKNFHFRDDVKEGRLTFSYKIHDGPCPTTNALKIMANEGLPVNPEKHGPS